MLSITVRNDIRHCNNASIILLEIVTSKEENQREAYCLETL